MTNGVHPGDGASGGVARAWAEDALGAVALAEGAVAQRILASASLGAFPLRAAANAFGDPVSISTEGDIDTQVSRARAHASQGERVALVARASALVGARPAMRAFVRDRLSVVFHALDEDGCPDAMALADLGWGVLLASNVEDSLDLSLVARRASEDSGTPFLVVHERGVARHVEPIVRPDAALCEAFLGTPAGRVRRVTDPAHPIHTKIGPRAFADRVPFALGSALREFEALTGRRHDVVERSAGTDAAVMIVAAGVLGESLLGEVERLRGLGADVGVVKVTALRPFPGPRIVRALGRSLAVTVLEGSDDWLAQSNPLTREVKASFADALTWAPDYPGVGRIPRITSGVIGMARGLDAFDLDSVVENMVLGERGKRLFAFGADPDLALPVSGGQAAVSGGPSPNPRAASAGPFVMRGVVRDLPTAVACAELCASVLVSAVALRTRATVRSSVGGHAHGVGAPAGFPQTPGLLGDTPKPPGEAEVTFEVVAGRERPRGAHAPHAVRLVALEDVASLIAGNPLARLADGGILAVPTEHRSPEALWASLPPYVKAIAFDRHLRVVGWPVTDGAGATGGEAVRWLTAAAFAGAALAGAGKADGAKARQLVDASLVGREVEGALRVVVGQDGAAIAEHGGQVARRAFESYVEVPRAIVERDMDGVRMGRHDERVAAR
jgi:pyruvate-ferredoxin/flavodoxin oxidoreductase